MIFVWSWEAREVPANWEAGECYPTFQEGQKGEPQNYRTVSLISMPHQVMESVILEVIEKHLEDNTVIGHNQYGFMRGKCCLSNLFSFHDRVSYLADQ